MKITFEEADYRRKFSEKGASSAVKSSERFLKAARYILHIA